MKKWTKKDIDKSLVPKLASGCGISSLAAAVLAAKGYTSADDVINKLEVSELSSPFLIRDMEIAADIINEAIETETPICVYGDYDCDGVIATTILATYLTEAGAAVTCYIPERAEGYGLNKSAVEQLHEDGIKLIITVDNGISAIEEAEYIYSLGMKLIITDHHQQGETLPRAEAILDPHRHDDCSPFKYSCGAVVALKLVAALDGGDYTLALEQFGDLAAIATIADIVNITGENRLIVRYGLELINSTDRPALIALKEVSGYGDKTIDAMAVGFGLAPRINAAGRFGSPMTALELFTEYDTDKINSLAQELDTLNQQRKQTENEITAEIYDILSKNPDILRDRVIVICGKNWNHGVIGIVAARIMEQFGKPCFIASKEHGEIRGSARSFGSFSVFSALTYAADVLEKFGGHPGAGGFTIKSGMENEFRRLINKYALENHKEMPFCELAADLALTPMDITIDNVEGLNTLEPFGMGNEKPVFIVENAMIKDIIPLSNGTHSKLRVVIGRNEFDALRFKTAPNSLPVKKGDICDMAVTLSVNNYMDRRSVNMYISDIRVHSFNQDKYFAALTSFEAFMRGEELPQAYYPAMLPTRDTAVMIYKLIPNEGITADNLYFQICGNVNYCRFAVAVEALSQLGLITVNCGDNIIRRVRVSQKADLDSAEILVKLRNISQKKG